MEWWFVVQYRQRPCGLQESTVRTLNVRTLLSGHARFALTRARCQERWSQCVRAHAEGRGLGGGGVGGRVMPQMGRTRTRSPQKPQLSLCTLASARPSLARGEGWVRAGSSYHLICRLRAAAQCLGPPLRKRNAVELWLEDELASTQRQFRGGEKKGRLASKVLLARAAPCAAVGLAGSHGAKGRMPMAVLTRRFDAQSAGAHGARQGGRRAALCRRPSRTARWQAMMRSLDYCKPSVGNRPPKKPAATFSLYVNQIKQIHLDSETTRMETPCCAAHSRCPVAGRAARAHRGGVVWASAVIPRARALARASVLAGRVRPRQHRTCGDAAAAGVVPAQRRCRLPLLLPDVLADCAAAGAVFVSRLAW